MTLFRGQGLVAVRHDEMLYSAVAHLTRYLGSPPPGRLHKAVFGRDLAVLDTDLPVGMGAVVGSGAFGVVNVAFAVREWTMFPYYAYYDSPGRAAVAERAMAGTGRWPHDVLGSWSATVPLPGRLRFCLACREDMLEQHPDLWWRRAHQVPSALVCVDHGEVLRESKVDREVRRSGYIAASLDICPSSAPALATGLPARVLSDLRMLARAGDALLDLDCDRHPDDRREGYLRRLARAGLLNRVGEAKLPAIARALDAHWGETLWLWPVIASGGRCGQRWLGGLLLGEHGNTPLHHLLFEGMLDVRSPEKPNLE